MVRRFFHYFHKEFSGLHEAALLLASFMFAAQLLALWRDRLLAATFGAGADLDIYYAAFRLPDLVYVSIASFVSVTVLIPFIVKKVDADQASEAKKFLGGVLTVFLVVMVALCLLLFLLLPKILPILIPGFKGAALEKLIILSRLLLLSPILLGISNLFGSVTQAFHRFFVYSLSPILYNLGIIFGLVFLYPRYGLTGLVYGVVFGALLHAVIQLPTIIRLGFLPLPTWRIKWGEIWEVVMISWPRTLALAMTQVSTLVLISLASLMSVGSIAVFNFAINLQSVPLSIVGISYSVAAFPTLSKIFGAGHREKFIQQLGVAIRHIIFWSMPATVLFIVLRAQVVRVILGSGNFGWSETKLVAAALAIFSLSIVAQSLILLLTRAYYAGGKTWRPLAINIFSAAITIGLAFVFSHLFIAEPLFRRFLESLLRVDGLAGTTILILPLAFSLGAIINLILLGIFFELDFGRLPRTLWRGAWQTTGAAIVGGAVSYLTLNLSVSYLDQNVFVGIFSQGLIAGLFGLLMMVLILKLLNNQELEELSQALAEKFWQAQPVVPSPEEI